MRRTRNALFADRGQFPSNPKKTSGVDTDLSREVIRDVMQEAGWRPVAMIAIDEVWSAMRFRPAQDVKSR